MTVGNNIKAFRAQLPAHVTLVAVSKTKPLPEILEAYNAGQLDFGENRVQELMEKQGALPQDIRWHLIGHLQTNKVKFIVPFVNLIHSVDSEKLLAEINKQAGKANRIIPVLLQIFIAQEETKFGFSFDEAEAILKNNPSGKYSHVRIEGLMGMATNTEDRSQVRQEFRSLKSFIAHVQEKNPDFRTLSMGMTSDWKIAIEEGSNLVRIGSALFGDR